MNSLLQLSLLGGLAVARTAATAACAVTFMLTPYPLQLPRAGSSAPQCSNPASTLSLADPPYNNYFHSDCNVAAQAVVTCPLPDSNLTSIGPRLIRATAVPAYTSPQNGINGTLSIELINSTVGNPLGPVYNASSSSPFSNTPSVGVQGILRFNSSATLALPILGSIRTIRDVVEGPSIVYPTIQDAFKLSSFSDCSASLQRLWLDNVTTTALRFQPWSSRRSSKSTPVTVNNRTLNFEAGDYLFTAETNYPQLTQLQPAAQLPRSGDNNASQTAAPSFLSYSEKLLAEAWRFLTYFGRDSMISALPLEPVLSSGNGSAMEAVLGAVLERVNRTDRSVCHEIINDYATWTNLQDNITSNAMICDYKMVDSNYYLPILMERYFLDNPVRQNRVGAFFNTSAGTINAANQNLTRGQLALVNAERIMRLAEPFANRQTQDNLIHLKDGQIVGQWRDSEFGVVQPLCSSKLSKTYPPDSVPGIGGGRIPFDPSFLQLSAQSQPCHEMVSSTRRNGKSKPTNMPKYSSNLTRTPPPSRAQTKSSVIGSDDTFYALALDGYNNLSKVEVMNTDDCFRHFLLNTTNDAPTLHAPRRLHIQHPPHIPGRPDDRRQHAGRKPGVRRRPHLRAELDGRRLPLHGRVVMAARDDGKGFGAANGALRGVQ
ncbi:uncharacterized protein N7459_002810 [Penicillium hispanicum]|uniref:uncharacterized protein n=1 Tax=Penicillium hispanicum TaxID=1080232 RepID=UPI002541666B|nr:uncharacterized protein N7459_002810 [Penicillium hispanicum]KAJ5587045.1 hypothetical protein N7459_002810 [Penicillium hispanicum]